MVICLKLSFLQEIVMISEGNKIVCAMPLNHLLFGNILYYILVWVEYKENVEENP